MKSKKRRPVHPVSKAVRQWMLNNDVFAVDVARALAVDQSAITHFIKGEMTSRSIREHFIRLGCPEQMMLDLEMLRETQRRAA